MKRVFLAALLTAAAAAAADPTAPAGASVTVYNNDLGLIRETRRLTFPKGTGEVRMTNVPARLDPSSVRLASDDATVLSQTFLNDLAGADRLLAKYIGREVEFQRVTDGGKRESVRGTLLSVENGRVLRSEGKLIVDPAGSPVLPEIPGLVTEPTLSWQVASKAGGDRDVDVSYLTGGLSWSADYVLELSPKDDRLDLTAWATVTDNAGADFRDARLKLIAGSVNRAPTAQPVAMAMRGLAKAAAYDGSAPSQESFSEYHLYAVPRPVTLINGAATQIPLARAQNVPVKKSFVFDPQGDGPVAMNDYTRTDPAYGQTSADEIWTILEFTNGADAHLGEPLPRGRVRVYKRDASGAAQLAGEDALGHTPANEKVRVRLGRAFDLVGERRQTSHVADKRSFEETYEITVTNRRDEAALVTAVAHLNRWSQWKITASSKPFRKKDAGTIEFDLPTPADGTAAVTYTVRYSW